MRASIGMPWPENKECAWTLRKLKENAKGETHALTFNPSWTSVQERPRKANKILCHQLSTFTLTVSRYTIRDLERLQG